MCGVSSWCRSFTASALPTATRASPSLPPPTPLPPQVGGPNFKADALSRVANESGHKLETEVLAPLTRWQDVHLQLVVSMELQLAVVVMRCRCCCCCCAGTACSRSPRCACCCRPHPDTAAECAATGGAAAAVLLLAETTRVAHWTLLGIHTTPAGSVQGAGEHSAGAGQPAAHRGRHVHQVRLPGFLWQLLACSGGCGGSCIRLVGSAAST